MDTLWALFDPNGTGHIDEDAFKKQDGLADTIIGELAVIVSLHQTTILNKTTVL